MKFVEIKAENGCEGVIRLEDISFLARDGDTYCIYTKNEDMKTEYLTKENYEHLKEILLNEK